MTLHPGVYKFSTMKTLWVLLFLGVVVTCHGQTGYYRDSSNRVYYLDTNNNRHYVYDSNIDRYGYRYYVDQYGQRRYLYNGNLIGQFEYETRTADFDLAQVGNIGRSETAKIFGNIWSEFRKSFVMTESGEFEMQEGANTPDNEQTRDAFLRFVKEHKPEVTVPFLEKCSRCEGTGQKTALIDRGYYNGLRMPAAGQVICNACNGTGGPKGVTIYRLSYNNSSIAQPNKPKEIDFSELSALAAQGDPTAQLSLGDYYWQGDGKAKDPLATNAIKWYGSSLLGGNTDAASKLVEVYAMPNVTRKSDVPFARALHYAFKSSNLDDSPSSSWLRISSRIADVEARVLAARIVQLRTSAKATQGQCIDPKLVRASLAEEYPSLLTQSKTGDPVALYQLGLRYATGLGGASHNDKVALIWLEQAACKGNADAYFILGAFYEDGTAYPRNPTAAYALYTISSKLLSREWAASERIRVLAPWINLPASNKAATNLLERCQTGKMTVDDIHQLVSLPPKVETTSKTVFNEVDKVSGIATTDSKETAESTPKVTSLTLANFGSGLVFTSNGHIFTTEKNIHGAKAIYIVRYVDGVLTEKLEAKLVKSDEKNDLAILQCVEWKAGTHAPSDPPPVVPSKYCRLADVIFTVGYAQTKSPGTGINYTQGNISSLSGVHSEGNKLQHTAIVEPGYAGGPLCLTDGRIVGMANNRADVKSDSLFGGPDLHISLKSDYMLSLAKSASIDVPTNYIDGPAMDHVKAYTVQIYCER